MVLLSTGARHGLDFTSLRSGGTAVIAVIAVIDGATACHALLITT